MASSIFMGLWYRHLLFSSGLQLLILIVHVPCNQPLIVGTRDCLMLQVAHLKILPTVILLNMSQTTVIKRLVVTAAVVEVQGKEKGRLV
jgi:hypothetical protein